MATTTDDGHVLVVDDDPGIRESVRFLLEDEGYTVEEAPDGVAGLSLLARSPEALIALVDYRMPRMDGQQLLDRVADDTKVLKRHAYVLFTANRDLLSPKFNQLLAARHIPIIEKPFEIDTLLNVVAHAHEELAESDQGNGA